MDFDELTALTPEQRAERVALLIEEVFGPRGTAAFTRAFDLSKGTPFGWQRRPEATPLWPLIALTSMVQNRQLTAELEETRARLNAVAGAVSQVL